MAKKKQKKGKITMRTEGKSVSYSTPRVARSSKKVKDIRKKISEGSKFIIEGTKNKVTGISKGKSGGIAGSVTIFTPSSNTEKGGKQLRDAVQEKSGRAGEMARTKKTKKRKKRPSDTTGFGHRSTYVR